MSTEELLVYNIRIVTAAPIGWKVSACKYSGKVQTSYKWLEICHSRLYIVYIYTYSIAGIPKQLKNSEN